MPFEFAISPNARLRLKNLGFLPSSLPQEYMSCCDLCEWTVFRTISHVDRYGFNATYQMCEGCGLVFQNPHPTAQGYEEFYSKWYRPLVAAFKGREDGETRPPSVEKSYVDRLVKLLKQYVRPGQIELAVDLGGSTGVVAKAIQDDFGGRCLVVDPSPDELAEARKLGLDCEQELAELWNPKDRRFDLALICRSIDHFLSISGVLKKIAGILKPGGLLFVDPVDFGSCARTEVDYRTDLKVDHVYYLSDETMRLFLNAAGFEVVACDFGGDTYYSSFLARYTGKIKKPSCPTAYAGEMGRMLRDRLAAPAPKPYPVDVLTRVTRRIRGRLLRV